MNQIHSVCVYSASSTKIAPVYFEAAEKLGSLLAKQHIRLINGAGSIGLMSSVADAVLKNGGEVTDLDGMHGVVEHVGVAPLRAALARTQAWHVHAQGRCYPPLHGRAELASHRVDGIDRSHFHARTQAEDGESE